MSIHFLVTKVIPVLAILAIYWLGSFNLPTVIFLPLALCIAVLVFYIAKKFGDTDTDSQKKK